MNRDATTIAPPEYKFEYEVISNDDLILFNFDLNQMVQRGWKVDGDLTLACRSASKYGIAKTIYAQRMVKINDR
jgi:hypothetical protein